MKLLPEAPLLDKAIVDAFGRTLWGTLHDLSVKPVEIRVDSEPSPLQRARVMTLTITVQPTWRQWAGRDVRVRDHRVTYQMSIPESDFYMMGAEEAIGEALKVMEEEFPEKVAPFLYEADPRIGTQVEVEGFIDRTTVKYPSSCLLFDPPGGIFQPLLKPPVDFPMTRDHFVRWSRCALCQAGFLPGDHVFWGGGNLLWACQSCADPDAGSLLR